VPPTTRIRSFVDHLIGSLFALVILGATLAFGGSVWWARPALAVITMLIVTAWLVRVLLQGRWRVLKSPLSLLGAAAVGLAVVQLAPLPSGVVSKLSPHSVADSGGGSNEDRAAADAESPPVAKSSAITVDRSSTLRWVMGAVACLALFIVAAHFADRLGHTLVIWGSVVAGFTVCTIFGVVQVAAGYPSLYGVLEPGAGPDWSPSLDELASTPNDTTLRLVADRRQPRLVWPVTRPERPFSIGGLMGGPGAYLALGSLGLPLGLGLMLQLLAPRGSRESMGARLRHTGRGGLSLILFTSLALGAGLVGYLSGPWLALPFALGLCVAGLPAARGTGLRFSAVGMTAAILVCLSAGVGVGWARDRLEGSSPLASFSGMAQAAERWCEAIRVGRDYPIVGSGLGGFATIVPYYKSIDRSATTAGSSVLQWWAEAGGVGLALLIVGAIWCLARLPGAIRSVGSADRALPFALVGALAAFGVLSLVHWTVEITAMAVAVCALGGVLNRWLAGGTDLFVEAV
jgi:hypothetical protein